MKPCIPPNLKCVPDAAMYSSLFTVHSRCSPVFLLIYCAVYSKYSHVFLLIYVQYIKDATFVFLLIYNVFKTQPIFLLIYSVFKMQPCTVFLLYSEYIKDAKKGLYSF